ncbi:16251_t:CDS:2, partial [Cetraspora pellucida]
MADSQTTIASLRELNSKLTVVITELRKKYAKIEAENTKLKQIMEENTEFKTRVSKLKQKLSHNDEEKGAPIAKLDDDTASYKTNSDDTPEQIKNISNNISNSDIFQESNIQYSKSLIHTESESSENKEIKFLNRIHRETVSNEIKERNQEKKLQTQSSLSYNKDNSSWPEKFVNYLIGIDKIKYVTCSANDISKLTIAQIQNIINQVTSKIISLRNNQNHVTETEASSNKNDDYYRITDKSLCSLCKLDNDDDNGIRGRYEVESYYIKCEQHRIEIEKAKLTELSDMLTDKIRSRLYKSFSCYYPGFTYSLKSFSSHHSKFSSKKLFKVLSNKLPSTISIFPTSMLIIGIRCQLARSWIGWCLRDIIVLKGVTIISHKDNSVITHSGGIISLKGSVGIIRLEGSISVISLDD